MSDEAPTRFVRNLRLGFILASIGVIGAIVFSGANLLLPASLFWVAGIWIITAERPNRTTIRPDKVLDDDRFRLAVRIASAAWPLYALLLLGLSLLNNGATPANPPSPLLNIPLIILMFCSGIIAWIGIIPTCIYFAELSYWASHDHLANRLRSTAWVMAVCGTIGALMLGIAVLRIGPSDAAGVVSGIMFVLVTIAAIVFQFTVIQLGLVMNWVIKHQKMAAGSSDRVRERIEREIKSPAGLITTGLLCRGCKYELDGLPFGGHCPECGESYADFTPNPILDPAKMHLDRDVSEIIIEEGENKGIYFNTELDPYGKPRSDGIAYIPNEDAVPLDGDIPLSQAQERENQLVDHDDNNDDDDLTDIPLADSLLPDDYNDSTDKTSHS